MKSPQQKQKSYSQSFASWMSVNQTIKDKALSFKSFGLGLLRPIDSRIKKELHEFKTLTRILYWNRWNHWNYWNQWNQWNHLTRLSHLLRKTVQNERGDNMSMNACVSKGSGLWGGETTLKTLKENFVAR